VIGKDIFLNNVSRAVEKYKKEKFYRAYGINKTPGLREWCDLLVAVFGARPGGLVCVLEI